MRKIKFRAWDKDIKSFVPIMDFILDVKNRKHRQCISNGMNGSKCNLACLLNGNYALMQFTGLHDKNGVEIYEGDIYKVIHNKHFWVYEVKSIGGQFGVMLFGVQLYSNLSVDENTDCYTYNITTENARERSYVASGKYVEVIGNIYENPELLNLECEN